MIIPAVVVVAGVTFLLFRKGMYTSFQKNKFPNLNWFLKGQKINSLETKAKFEILGVWKETKPFVSFCVPCCPRLLGLPGLPRFCMIYGRRNPQAVGAFTDVGTRLDVPQPASTDFLSLVSKLDFAKDPMLLASRAILSTSSSPEGGPGRRKLLLVTWSGS